MKGLFFLFLCLFLTAKGYSQISITANAIAEKCSVDSGNPAANYREYSERLAVTLGQISPQALARVFGQSASVQVAAGDILNDVLSLDNIEFPLLSAVLPTSSADALGSLAEFLTENPDLTIQVEGHVSQDFLFAQSLSEQRAENTRNYLIGLGIDPSRIEAVGLGYQEPIEGASDSENRRIEFVVLGGE